MGHLCRDRLHYNLLTFLHSMHNANDKLMRWLLFLQPYTINVCRIKGNDNVMADALSRMPCQFHFQDPLSWGLKEECDGPGPFYQFLFGLRVFFLAGSP